LVFWGVCWFDELQRRAIAAGEVHCETARSVEPSGEHRAGVLAGDDFDGPRFPARVQHREARARHQQPGALPKPLLELGDEDPTSKGGQEGAAACDHSEISSLFRFEARMIRLLARICMSCDTITRTTGTAMMMAAIVSCAVIGPR
jgi:hypothetical protein